MTRFFAYFFMICMLSGISGNAFADDGEMTFDVGGVKRQLYSSSEALLIYGSNYTAGWESLPAIPDEIERLKVTLESHQFRVKILPNATGNQIEQGVKQWIAENGQSNKRLFIYFSGHGWIDSRKRGYLVPTDAPRPSTNLAGFLAAAISESKVKGWAEDIGSRHALFIFDSCFSGAMFGKRGLGSIPNVPTGPLSRAYFEGMLPEGVAFMSATDALTEVPSSSAYTARIIGGLSGAADIDGDGYILSSELGEWIKSTFSGSNDYRPRWGIVGDRWSDYGAIFVSPRGPRTQTNHAAKPSLFRKIAFQSQSTDLSGAAANSVKKNIPTNPLNNGGWFIRYYEKEADNGLIIDLLDKIKVNYLAQPPQVPTSFPTNAIACHPDGDAVGVRTLALSLFDIGISIKAILPFRKDNISKPIHRLEIVSLGTLPKHLEKITPLSRKQIEAISSCRSLYNG